MENSENSTGVSVWRWIKGKAWWGGLVLLTVLNVAAYLRTAEIIKQLKGAVIETRADVKGVKVALDGLTDIPLAYRESPEGLKLTHADKGNTKAELEFLDAFRGRFLPKDVAVKNLKSGEWIARMHDTMLRGYAENRALLSSYNLSERQSLIAYAVLRTNGSMPTYEVRDLVPNNLEQLVVGPTGNCADYALRLMMALESMGLRAATITSVTDAIPGHVVVDAYDSEEDKAYLLDANFNVMLMHPHSGGRSFIEHLRENKETPRQFARDTQLITFPTVVRFVDPGETAYTSTPLTPASSINNAVSASRCGVRGWSRMVRV